MIQSAAYNSIETKKSSERPVGHCFTDIHCHCLPCIDDGPSTMSESLALCKSLVEDGITTVIATPHQLGRFSECNNAATIRQTVNVLCEELRSNGIVLNVIAGADIRMDERICRLLKTDKILTLADKGKHVLLELPHEIFIDIEPLLIELSYMGVQAIISHPERHCILSKMPQVLQKWLRHSVCFQITSGSLLGEFGYGAQKAAWKFLSMGLASIVATDAHDSNVRGPRMTSAFKHISIKLGKTLAKRVCIDNPSKILQGQDITVIPFYQSRDLVYENGQNSL